jgi:hypothetical protein
MEKYARLEKFPDVFPGRLAVHLEIGFEVPQLKPVAAALLQEIPQLFPIQFPVPPPG